MAKNSEEIILLTLSDMHRYFVINKPRGIVSQFVSPHKVGLLGDIGYTFPLGTHALGRLDKDSEGLLLLTTDKRATHLLFTYGKPHRRTYLVMVQHELSAASFNLLRTGINIKIKDGADYIATPADLKKIENPAAYYSYAADNRESYPHTWLLITLTEGKYRQVRKMVLAAHHRCLRLIRLSIGNFSLNDLKPGEVQELTERRFYDLLDVQPK